ncbi:IS1182 family transposase, partial [Paracraurococcus lichenis]
MARLAFPQGNPLLSLRDRLGPVFDDRRFVQLFPGKGQPAEAPWRLALVTLLQFAEELSDRQAAEAVRSRIDWKYLLGLSLTDAGFDSTVLSEFRARLVAGAAEALLLDAVLEVAAAHQLLKAGGRQRTDSTHVLAATRAINRIECVHETLRHALEVLTLAAPTWLLMHVLPHWAEAYGRRAFDERLPRSAAKRAAWAQQIGEDGHHLLAALDAAATPDWLRQLPGAIMLRRVWIQQFYVCDSQVQWRGEREGIPPASRFISSPYDVDAHYACKRSMTWIGYKVHLTETCDEGLPRIITEVQTTAGPIADGDVTTPIHHALQDKGLLPAQHLVDTGYIAAGVLVETQRDFGIDLVGPARANFRWQSQAGKGFGMDAFAIDWDAQQVTCPMGIQSSGWSPALDNRGTPVIKVKFSTKDCRACAHRADCAGPTATRRLMTIRTREAYIALQAARQRQQTPEFLSLYALRAGVEATISLAARTFGLRRSRYLGQAKPDLDTAFKKA